MARTIPLDDLTAEERIELMGRLWDNLDSALAAPISPDVVAELDFREAEADSAPDEGYPWSDIRHDLQKKLK